VSGNGASEKLPAPGIPAGWRVLSKAIALPALLDAVRTALGPRGLVDAWLLLAESFGLSLVPDAILTVPGLR